MCLIHQTIKTPLFKDHVSKKMVYRFDCEKCGAVWIANSRTSLFRVELGK